MDVQFRVYSAQKTWCDHPRCTQKEARVRKANGLPSHNPSEQQTQQGNPGVHESSEMLGRGLSLSEAHVAGGLMRMGHGMVRKGNSPGSLPFLIL